MSEFRSLRTYFCIIVELCMLPHIKDSELKHHAERYSTHTLVDADLTLIDLGVFANFQKN